MAGEQKLCFLIISDSLVRVAAIGDGSRSRGRWVKKGYDLDIYWGQRACHPNRTHYLLRYRAVVRNSPHRARIHRALRIETIQVTIG